MKKFLLSSSGVALKAIKLEGDVLEWVIQALKSGHEDEKRYHNEVIASLQREYARLQHRLDQMYVDKLDGKISQEFYDEKSTEWRKEQSEVRRKMEKHENANYSYMDEGIRILELSNRAWELYDKQEMAEKRRLLDYVFSNSTWAGGKLTPNYRKPFDLISDAVKMQEEEEAKTGAKFDKTAKNENWLTTLPFFEILSTSLRLWRGVRFGFPQNCSVDKQGRLQQELRAPSRSASHRTCQKLLGSAGHSCLRTPDTGAEDEFGDTKMHPA